MRVSQRLDYALRAVVLLAAQPRGEHIPAGELAERLVLPRRFVEQQITALARAGLVECRRGAAGGCALARPASDITAYEVVIALEGEVIDVPQRADSAASELWRGVAEAAEDHLRSITIARLLERQRELDALGSPMYYI